MKSIGVIFLLSGFMTGLAAAFRFMVGSAAMPTGVADMRWWVTFLLAASVLQCVAGIGLIGRHEWSRRPAIALSTLAIPAFPIGTIFGLYFIYILTSGKAKSILSRNNSTTISPDSAHPGLIWAFVIASLLTLYVTIKILIAWRW